MASIAAGAAVLAGGCGGGGGNGDGGGAGAVEDLEARVVSVLGLGDDAVAECPVVRDPEPGDRATCDVRDGAEQLEVDVEFEPGGAIAIVNVVRG